jgi:beta-galactosidase
VWTGFDYLGEPTPYTNEWTKANGLTDREAARGSYFGIVDMCGIPKDRYYLYKSHWKTEENMVHLLPHWNWPENVGQVPVMVYTNGDCAELFLNGKSQGKRCKNPKSTVSTERFRLVWTDITYQPGELKAIAYRDGSVIGEKTVRTAGEPVAFRLTADRKSIKADGMDLAYILVEAVDKNGNLCPLAADEFEVQVSKPLKKMGLGNGNPQALDNFQGASLQLFNGKAMVIVGAADKGEGQVSLWRKGSAVATIKVKAE